MTWAELSRNRMILLLLAITALQTSGQFALYTFMGPLLKRLTGAGPDAIELVFALFGTFGFIVATRIVDNWSAYRTTLLSTSLVLIGVTAWTLIAGIYPLMALAAAIWGTGFAATNSTQQCGWWPRAGEKPSLRRASSHEPMQLWSKHSTDIVERDSKRSRLNMFTSMPAGRQLLASSNR